MKGNRPPGRPKDADDRESPADRTGQGAYRRNLQAIGGVLLVLLAFGGFSLWCSQVTSHAAARVGVAQQLADDYQDAAAAVALEQSLQRAYLLQPSAAVKDEYRQATDDLVTALNQVGRDGGAVDRKIARSVLDDHRQYVQAADRLFTALPNDDPDTLAKLDAEQVEPFYRFIETSVTRAADERHASAAAALTRLKQAQRLTRQLMPIVFVAATALIAAMALISRRQSQLLVAHHAQAVRASLHDSLTGLPNRTLFQDRVGQALRAGDRANSQLAVLIIDLDRFKEVNDTFGHHYGDGLLVEVAARLQSVVRLGDTIARLGGDEFAVLLSEVSGLEEATGIADRITKILETSFTVDEITIDIEASIGLAHSQEHGRDAAQLQQYADAAMYTAKTHGLGLSVYQRSAAASAPARLGLLGDLRRALNHDELTLYYQPKVAIDGTYSPKKLDSGTNDPSRIAVVGVEALLRWHHPEKGVIPPDSFIPLAEHTGLIGPLTRYVLNQAIACAGQWHQGGQDIPVAVNLSARNLLDSDLPEVVSALLTRHRLPAALLHLEVTESAIMTEQTRAARLLRELSELGIQISIDDFGAGYTSLSQLKTLPLHELKIDRSFVTTMTEDPANATIVRSVVELGHNLGLTIVAEGVETADALNALGGYGCDVAQGYLFTPPLPLEKFDAWYRSHHRFAHDRAH